MTQTRSVVLGVDSSTQATKVVVLDLDDGHLLAEARAAHTGETVQDPRMWWQALVDCVRGLDLSGFEVCGIAIGGQQHGLVTLDRDGAPVVPAPLWNNTEAAADAARLNRLADFPGRVGSALVASFTIAKVAHLARTSPALLDRVVSICLPHDYVTSRLTGVLTTDRSDASGSGWWGADGIDRDLLALATNQSFAERAQVPVVLGPDAIAGRLTPTAAAELGLPVGIPVGPGAGDNAAAAIGIGATPDELVVSLGTSGVVFAVSDRATADATGEVCGFADATGRYLPLVCMINCTQVVNATAALIDMPVPEALDLAGTLTPGADGLWMEPYFGGERTPNLPNATGSLHGVTYRNLTPAHLMRAAVDGVAAGLRACQDSLAEEGIVKAQVTLVGGGSRHATWQQAIADASGLPVTVRAGGEHVARGAATQIAAIIRTQPILALAEAWRPSAIAETEPIPPHAAGFRLNERRGLIAVRRLSDGVGQ